MISTGSLSAFSAIGVSRPPPVAPQAGIRPASAPRAQPPGPPQSAAGPSATPSQGGKPLPRGSLLNLSV